MKIYALDYRYGAPRYFLSWEKALDAQWALLEKHSADTDSDLWDNLDLGVAPIFDIEVEE